MATIGYMEHLDATSVDNLETLPSFLLQQCNAGRNGDLDCEDLLTRVAKHTGFRVPAFVAACPHARARAD